MSLTGARLSLNGLAIGDGFGNAFGERFVASETNRWLCEQRLPPAPWLWTDDTHMALSIVETLEAYGEIHQDALASRFVERFVEDPYRGYGRGAFELLSRLAKGGDWRELAPQLFPGGSYGNGAAMRVAPLGTFYAGEPQVAAEQARRSAVVTHAHEEGQAGAIAVAVAASIASGGRDAGSLLSAGEFLRCVLGYIPQSEVRRRIQSAMTIPAEDQTTAMEALGTGWQVSAQDTVPFCLWCAAHSLADFAAGLWRTVAGSGDCDTTCAIVGGILAGSTGAVPSSWYERCEPLPLREP